jgi:hypothetical protein
VEEALQKECKVLFMYTYLEDLLLVKEIMEVLQKQTLRQIYEVAVVAELEVLELVLGLALL